MSPPRESYWRRQHRYGTTGAQDAATPASRPCKYLQKAKCAHPSCQEGPVEQEARMPIQYTWNPETEEGGYPRSAPSTYQATSGLAF
eukprot:330486-Pyramimonas_sp.AAC.1